MNHSMIYEIAMILASAAALLAELRKWRKPSRHDDDQKL
jgi:hypothetical protein